MLFLAFGTILTPTGILGGGLNQWNCSGNVMAEYQQVGDYLARNIPAGSRVYWEGGNAVAILLYVPNIKIFPQQMDGQWNYYPDDHIGRLKGEAVASNGSPLSGPAGPSAKPLQPWAFDQNIYGTNDFRSTKMNIINASLSDGFTRVNIASDGSQSIRCWKEDQKTKLLIASYSNMGAERFFRGHAQLMDKPLKPGDQLTGNFTITFSNN